MGFRGFTENELNSKVRSGFKLTRPVSTCGVTMAPRWSLVWTQLGWKGREFVAVVPQLFDLWQDHRSV